LNKKSKDRLIATEDKSLDALKEQGEKENENDLFEFTENILSQLKDTRIKKIFSMRYSNSEKKPSWCIIANKMSVSTQTAINLHNRGIEILRKKIKSEKLLDNV
jgi:DNA-directed RNA polymerase specialized sigma subunit